MSILRIIDNKELIRPDEVMELFAYAPWTNERTIEQVEKMLDHSSLAVLALLGNKPVGFARVITDHVFRAFIEDVIVHPKFRKQGVGKKMVVRIQAILDSVRQFELTTRKIEFWERLGFCPKEGTTHMIKRFQ